ncbi:MAG: DUF1015 domain-containing protein [Bacteroidetes bacterium]|nr:MAG: DUF1015 domain-containing protein [Bacteroidota bacterium]
MAIIKPFKGLRPKPDLAEQVASRPYDVLSSEEARVEAKDNPYSFLHITKSEIDLPGGVDVHSDVVYQKAKENFDRFIGEGILFEEDKPCYYIYELTMDGKGQTGLVCLSSVEDYVNDVIKKHEFTRPEKEKDRIDHMLAIRAQTGNVFLAYRDVEQLNKIIAEWKAQHKPVYDFIAVDEIRHAIWRINQEPIIDSISEILQSKVPVTYIADGHHRAASAAKVSQQLPSSKSAKYFLTTIFPASELKILDYNRVVKDLNGLSVDDFLKKVEIDFAIQKTAKPFAPKKTHQFGLYLEKQWYILTSRGATIPNDPVGILDVSILSNDVLDKLLGIKDQRTDKRIDFVGGIRGLSELEKRVNSGEMRAAFSLHPVSIQQLFDIADSGKTMPPKSTWFEPKLRDGLLTHTFD